MSRRAAIVEEEFDDDTDLPLPNKPLPNTGARGALLEELDISEDEDDTLNNVCAEVRITQNSWRCADGIR